MKVSAPGDEQRNLTTETEPKVLSLNGAVAYLEESLGTQ